MSHPDVGAPPFIRTRRTWFIYLMLGYYAYLLNALGPMTPFLQAELKLSYTISSLHFSAFAIGLIIAALVVPSIARRLGQRASLWLGGAGLLSGALVVVSAAHPLLTIGGCLMMGLLGGLIIVLIPPMLARMYGAQSVQALTEANSLASLFGLCAPLSVGFFAGTTLGWRAPALLLALALALLALAFWRVEPGEPDQRPAGVAVTRLPGHFWRYWIMLTLGISVEFCILFWGATFLERQYDLDSSVAVLTMTGFISAMLIGRLIGSRLVRRHRAELLTRASLSLALLGFLLHWQLSLLPLSIAGLFIAGLGVANLYPLIFSLALRSAPGQSVQASARSSLGGGVAILLLPLLLGALADLAGIGRAYGLPLLLLALALMLLGRAGAPQIRRARRAAVELEDVI